MRKTTNNYGVYADQAAARDYPHLIVASVHFHRFIAAKDVTCGGEL
jgi:hypothetical protein